MIRTALSPFWLVAVGNAFYVLSEVLLKLFPPNASVLEVSLVRFGCGLVLLFFVHFHKAFNYGILLFAAANILNSIIGYAAILFGSYQGFAVASQFRPLFVGIAAWIVFKDIVGKLDLVVMIACLLLALYMAGADKNLFSLWTVLFLITVFIQSLSFAAIGRSSQSPSTLEYISFYNLFGFLVVLSIGSVSGKISYVGISNSFWILLASGGSGLAGSLLVVAGLQASHKSKNIIGTFFRFPLSLLCAVVLLGETLETSTLLAASLMMALLFWVGNRSRREKKIKA